MNGTKTAIEKAELEWRDHNEERGIRHLDEWFSENSGQIAEIALHLAKFHISRSVPDPRDHLKQARRLLRLAREAEPENSEIHELWLEFDKINGALQELMILAGDSQIVWNSGMAHRIDEKGRALIPVVQTFRDIAYYCNETGRIRLTPIFAERAASLAQTGGRALKPLWFSAETEATWFHSIAGRSREALKRIESALLEAAVFLSPRDNSLLRARYFRASVFHSLGRYVKALAEIDALLPIEAEVLGEHHSGTLSTRHLRASVLQILGRYGEALAEIDALLLIEAEVKGERHPGTLSTRHLRASVLQMLGRSGEALAEIDTLLLIEAEVLGERHPSTLSTRHLRASVLQMLGRYGEALAEIDALLPIELEVKGERHPGTLTTRYLHASVLHDFGRYGEAFAEIDVLVPISAEVKGERHHDTLTIRQLHVSVLQMLGRSGEALAEIDTLLPIGVQVSGERHLLTLTTRHLRASVLQMLGRTGEALAEIDVRLPIDAEALGEHHPGTLATRSLRIGIEIAKAADLANVEYETELLEIISALLTSSSASNRQTLSSRYRLSRFLFQRGDAMEARTIIIETISHFDQQTDPAEPLLRSAKALLHMIDGRATQQKLIA